MRNPTTCGNITTSAWAKKKPSPTSEPGQAMFELDGDRNRHEAELAHVFDLVVVQVSLSDLPVLTAQDLHGLAHNLLVGRRDDAHRSFEGTRVNTLHRDLLDDPGAAHDFVTNRHLAVWKALEPAQRVCGGVSRAVEVHSAGRLELDLGCVKREQCPLIVGIERGNELDGGVFGLSHCVSSFGVTAKRGPRLLPPYLAGQPEGAQAPTSVHETSRSIARNGYGRVLISGLSAAHASYLAPRPPPNSGRRRRTFAACCWENASTGSRWGPCGPSSPKTWKSSSSCAAAQADRARPDDRQRTLP